MKIPVKTLEVTTWVRLGNILVTIMDGSLVSVPTNAVPQLLKVPFDVTVLAFGPPLVNAAKLICWDISTLKVTVLMKVGAPASPKNGVGKTNELPLTDGRITSRLLPSDRPSEPPFGRPAG